MADKKHQEEAKELMDDFDWTYETYWNCYIKEAHSGSGDSGRFLLRHIQYQIKQYGYLAEPIRGYLVEILDDVLRAEKSDLNVALKIQKEGHRKKGSGESKYKHPFLMWYGQELIRQGLGVKCKLSDGEIEKWVNTQPDDMEHSNDVLKRWVREARKKNGFLDALFAFKDVP